MPRKSTKPASVSASRSSSKRPALGSPTRQSKRARATAGKSYVEPDTDAEDAANDTASDTRASDYEDHSDNDAATESEPDAEVTDEEGYSEKVTPRGRPVKQKTLPLHKKHNVGEKDLWKSGAKLEPGTQVIIKKPKAREAGKTPYTDNTIHPNTLLFLRDLAANNDRQWLKLHDPDYRVALQDFNTFLENLSEKVIEVDETIPELPVKDIIYRIYRDIRFSKDPTPYKTYFSAAWSRTGRKGPYASYYVQVQPDGGSFVGGGFWQPDAGSLSKLRHDIDHKPHKMKRVLTNAGIRRSFLGGVAEDEKEIIKAFVSLRANQASALKRNPKGYDPTHKDIDLLRLRSFTLGRKLSDDEVVGPQGLDRLAELVNCMVPWITYLNSIVMPDDEQSSSSSEEAESSGNDDDGNDDNGADEGTES
ncbi:hypothetical protein P153DRAFT_395258 [Dothidotthia symphoricarpi CBS 119687]|uniref:Uncharacterized protein n=1 Tax=Dothidotthia symphoricarpi CBS 119687 TaxID=1392245 RepID=A0A6A6AG04_9PLEO|nr:uncharacterized protein P153DRAFT_395258 [Dothidotthia symphoricarpi CBS 119687]KAF2130839.1 hypothetical protein P153DRAFT_395258 [Dothidotthia symphoricarpi CBS 119687]